MFEEVLITYISPHITRGRPRWPRPGSSSSCTMWPGGRRFEAARTSNSPLWMMCWSYLGLQHGPTTEDSSHAAACRLDLVPWWCASRSTPSYNSRAKPSGQGARTMLACMKLFWSVDSSLPWPVEQLDQLVGLDGDGVQDCGLERPDRPCCRMRSMLRLGGDCVHNGNSRELATRAALHHVFGKLSGQPERLFVSLSLKA